jgi:hypothetical protein
MIEPDWSTAPRWAQWFAVDGNGKSWWYEIKPSPKWDSPRGMVCRVGEYLASAASVPSWAQWFAVDGDGEAWWYEVEPVPGWDSPCGMVDCANDTKIVNWEKSLRQRPTGEKHDRT